MGLKLPSWLKFGRKKQMNGTTPSAAPAQAPAPATPAPAPAPAKQAPAKKPAKRAASKK